MSVKSYTFRKQCKLILAHYVMLLTLSIQELHHVDGRIYEAVHNDSCPAIGKHARPATDNQLATIDEPVSSPDELQRQPFHSDQFPTTNGGQHSSTDKPQRPSTDSQLTTLDKRQTNDEPTCPFVRKDSRRTPNTIANQLSRIKYRYPPSVYKYKHRPIDRFVSRQHKSSNRKRQFVDAFSRTPNNTTNSTTNPPLQLNETTQSPTQEQNQSSFLNFSLFDNLQSPLIKFNINNYRILPGLYNVTTRNYSEARTLAKEVRVLCLILTMPENHYTKAVHVKATWGRRCNKLIFMSSIEDTSLGAVGLNVTEGRDLLWGKTKAAFKYVYEHHRDDADWFLKADDDTYVIMKNLRYLLREYNASNPLYFGRQCWFYEKKKRKWPYMCGGPGYVLSRTALHWFVGKGLRIRSRNRQICTQSDSGDEDAMMGLCLNRLGVTSVLTRDSRRRERFYQDMPLHHYKLHKKGRKKNKKPLSACSDSPISFHHVIPENMYALEYLLYRLRPYDDSRSNSPRQL